MTRAADHAARGRSAEREDLRAALDWATSADPCLRRARRRHSRYFWFAQAPHEGARARKPLRPAGDRPARPSEYAYSASTEGPQTWPASASWENGCTRKGSVLARAMGDDQIHAARSPRGHTRAGGRGTSAHRSGRHAHGGPRASGARGAEPRHARRARRERGQARGCARALHAKRGRRRGVRLHPVGYMAADGRGGHRAQTGAARHGGRCVAVHSREGI